MKALVSRSSITEKPTLVIVAPFPPIRSGIADYVAHQVTNLQKHYQLILVDDAHQDSETPSQFPGVRITSQTLLETPVLHRRVLYHLGNSPVHLPAFELLKVVPGLVVLHDFFLSDVQQYKDIILLGNIHASFADLIHSHGYAPLLNASESEQPLNLSDYPCNLGVLEQARKVLVHSDYVLQQAVNWYGQGIRQKIGRIRFASEPLPSFNRISARKSLGFNKDAYVVGTFGFATPAKCLEALINAWATSQFAHSSNAALLIVGEFLDNRYKSRIHRLLELRRCPNIRLLGYQEREDYNRYLAAADVAIQLRTRSRGETSAALLDCLANGVPVVANNHGFVEDLPEHVLWKTRAQPDVSELTAVLEHLHGTPVIRESLVCNGLDYIAEEFDPKRVVAQLADEIEALAEDLATQPENSIAEENHRNRQKNFNRQLLVDITAVASFDLRTGIQRVVRALLRELVLDPPNSYRVLPIYIDQQGAYRYAHRFMLQALGYNQETMEDKTVSVRAGDVYLGVDLHTTTTVRYAAIYNEWRKQGVRIVNVLYDLLPIHKPQWFPAIVAPDFNAWLHHIATHSDQVIAISQTVAEDLAEWVKEQGINQQRSMPLDIKWFHLGADLEATVPTVGLPNNATEQLKSFAAKPSFLMVGTVEPRKGHVQVLDAFERLWANGHEYNLIIVGKQGWQMEALIKRLRQHPELDNKLFWLEGISDEYLEQIYPSCTALIAASEGEGFGLPLIEAARHHIPVIARDIKIFREIGGSGAYYFNVASADQLAEEIQKWMHIPIDIRPDVNQINCLTWRESAQQLRACLSLDS